MTIHYSMKRFVCIVIFISLLMSFTGCEKRKQDSNYNRVSYCDTLNLYTEYDNQLISYEKGILEYEDFSIGKSVVLCSKPNCKHQEYDYFSNASPECEAAVSQGSASYQGVVYDGNTIYQLADTENVNETILYSSALESPGRKEICKIPYSVAKEAGIYLYNNYIYMVGQFETIDEVNHTAGTSGVSLTIIRVNVNSGDYEKLSPEYYNNTLCQIINFYMEGEMLYYELRTLKDGISLTNTEEEYNWDELLETHFYGLSIDGKCEPQKIIDNYDNISFLLGLEKGKLFYVDKNRKNICCMDLTKQSTDVYLNTGTMERCEKYSGEQFIYVLQDKKVYYKVNDENPRLICQDGKTIDFPIGIFGKYVYMDTFDENENARECIMLDDYLNGKAGEINE